MQPVIVKRFLITDLAYTGVRPLSQIVEHYEYTFLGVMLTLLYMLR